MSWQRKLHVKDALIRGEHAARCNIAAGRHRAHLISTREFRAEVERAATIRDNKTGEMILDVIKNA
jgi:hypothetical protein